MKGSRCGIKAYEGCCGGAPSLSGHQGPPVKFDEGGSPVNWTTEVLARGRRLPVRSLGRSSLQSCLLRLKGKKMNTVEVGVLSR